MGGHCCCPSSVEVVRLLFVGASALPLVLMSIKERGGSHITHLGVIGHSSTVSWCAAPVSNVKKEIEEGNRAVVHPLFVAMQPLFLMCKKERRERNYAGSPQRCRCRCVVDCHVADGDVAAASCVRKGNGEESHVACLVCCLLLVARSPMVSWPLLLM